jgi:hypothetical protein
VMIVRPAGATEPVEQSARTSTPKRQRNRGWNAEVALTIRDGLYPNGRRKSREKGSDPWTRYPRKDIFGLD